MNAIEPIFANLRAKFKAAARGEKLPFRRTLIAESLEKRVLLAADPLSVARVTGSIDSAGEVDHFTFHLDSAARLSFDSLIENGNLHWNLSGPSGAIVSNEYFRALSGNGGSYAPLDLAAGDYTIDVNGQGDTTGAYDMRLLDLARATPIALETPVTGSFDANAETLAFVFDGTAGDRLFLDITQNAGTYLRVYDPYGQQINSGYGDYYSNTLPTLAYTGRYTVLLDSQAATGAGYGFSLHRSVSPVQELGSWSGAALPVSGTLSGPQDTAVIHFTLATDRTVALDSLTGNDQMLLSLIGPNGGVVIDANGQSISNRALNSYVDYGYYGSSFANLKAGNYTLTITGNGGTTGAYALQLLDVAAATVISKGAVVSGQLSPANSLQIYQFSATAGDNINFDALSTGPGSPNVKLLDPSGRYITWASSFYDLNNLSLASTGVYTLFVSGEDYRDAVNYGPTDYSFQLVDNGNTPVVLPVGTPINLGDVQVGSLAGLGDTQVYNFTLSEDKTIYFDPESVPADYYTYWSLQGPRGVEVTDSHFGWYGEEGARVLKLVAGSYALTVRSANAASPEFSFRLVDLAAATAPLALNTDTAGQLSPGSAAAAYSFDATAGQHVFFKATNTDNGGLRWRLLGPDGNEVVGNTGWGDWESNLASSGKYTVLIEGYNSIGAAPINYRFGIYSAANKQAVYDPAASSGLSPQWTSDGAQAALAFNAQTDVIVTANPALNLSNDVSFQTRVKIDAFDQTWQSIVYKGGSTTSGGDRSYSLWLNANGSLDLSTSDQYGELQLSSPVGSIQAGQWYDIVGVIDRTNSKLRIYINGALAASGDLRTIYGGAKVQDTPLYLGRSYEGWGQDDGQLRGAMSEFRLWDTALTATDVSGLQGTPPSAADPHLKAWLKFDEAAGATLADASASGLSARVHNRFEGLTGVAAGTIDVPGQTFTYTLSLPEAKTFYLDSLTGISSNNGYYPFNLQISGPRTGFNENLTYFYNRLITLPAGDYTITVDGNGRPTGPFAFRLIDTAVAQHFTFGDAVSGDLNPGDTAKLYSFDATAGDAAYFYSLGASGFNPAWRLIDPFGREVFGRTGLADRDTTTLAYTGRYLLIVDGDYGNNDQSSHFSFRLNNVTPTTTQTFDIAVGLDAGVQRTAGQASGAVLLSDAQYIEIPNTPATNATGSFTIETSFKIDQNTVGSWIPLLTKTTADALRQYGLFINRDGRMHLGSYPDNSQGYSYVETASGLVTAGVWHKVAAVFDRANSQMRLVLDGVTVATGYLNPEAAVSLADPLRLGYNTEGYDFYGYQVQADQLSLWDKALSTAEVAAADATTLTGSEANLAGLYCFDEASGTALTDAKGGAAGAIVRLASRVPGLVTGRINGPGQTQSYQFTLAADTQVYFDSLTRRGDIRWSLTGPTVSTSDSYYYGDSTDSHGLMNLAAGTYTFKVDADNAAIGDYMFRLLNVAGATTIALDQTVNGHLDPGQVAQIFHFDATAGQQLYFDTLSATSVSPAWRLIDPSGAAVFGVNSFGDRDTTTLSRSGTYTLIVEDYGPSGQRNPARDYSFNLRTVSNATTPLTLGVSQFRPLQWTAGPVLGETAVKFDGGNQLLSDPSAALDLTGDFTVEAMVKVDAFGNSWTPLIHRGSNSGSQQTFGLYLGSSGQVNLDSNWQGNFWNIGSAYGAIQPGQWYRVSATVDRTAGVARIFVNGVQVASGAIDTRAALSLPDARLHVGSSDMNDGSRGELLGAVSDVRVWSTVRSAADIAASANQTLDGSQAGLLVNLALDEGTGSALANTGSLGAALHMADVSLYSTTPSTVVEGRISQIGSTQTYTFTAAADGRIAFDGLTPDSRITWSLATLDGAVIDNFGQNLTNRTLRDSDAYSRVAFFVKAGQSYRLTVDANGDVTGNFAFRLANFADAQVIAYDTPTTWTPDQARTTGVFAFDATAGDQVIFDRINYTDTRPITRIYDPAGRDIFSGDFYYDSNQYTGGSLKLTLTGRYTVLLEGQIDSRGQQQQSFQIQKTGFVAPPALPVGTPVSFVNGVAQIDASITAVDTPQVFSFNLPTARRIYIDQLNGANQYYNYWTLTGANDVIDSRVSYSTDSDQHLSYYDLPAGDYTISLSTPYDWALGATSYRLIDTAAAALPIVLDTPITGTLNPATSTQVYQFDGTANDRLFFNTTSQSGMNAYWRLIHADTGAVVAGNDFGSNLDGVVLSRTGSYLLELAGRYYAGGGVGSYGFTVSKSSDTTQALTLGTTVNSSLAKPGDTQRYSFNLATSSKLLFDELSSREGLVWRVLDHDGVSVFGDRPTNDYGYYYYNRVDLAAGDYTLVIDGSNNTVGDFAFRLLNLSSATTITPGTAVSGQLAPASEADIYQFQATAGDSYFFDMLGYSGGNGLWNLLDPYGNNVFAPTYLNDQGTRTLAYTGTYTLLIEGYRGDGGTPTYSFNVTPVVNQAPVALSIGVLPGPNLVVQDLAVVGADASGIHSGGSLAVSWTSANTGDRDVTAPFQERVIVKNAAGETLVNQLAAYDVATAGAILAGTGRARSATVSLPAGERGAGLLTISVITDVTNSVVESGATGESDNSASTQVTSTLLIYPDLTVANIALTPSSGLAGGDQASVSWRINNSGEQATTGAWSDHVVVRNVSTGEVVFDQTTRVDAASAAVAAGGGIDRQIAFTWPTGRRGSGQFQVTVSTDVLGDVAEYNASDTGETNNSASISLTNAPDLVVANLQVLDSAPQSGDTLHLQWTLSNDGNAATPQGWFDRVQIVNTMTGETITNVDVAYDPVAVTGAALAAGDAVLRTFNVKLPAGLRSVGDLRITVTADQNASGASLIPESDEGNNASSVLVHVTTKPAPNLVATSLTAPTTQRSGDAAHFSFTVSNVGNAATDASNWVDRLVLSRDAIIGNGDDVVIATVPHSGAVAAGGSYSSTLDAIIPAGLDGNYSFALVTDAFNADTEPDTRADNTSALQPVLLTAYHADLQSAFTVVPANATGGSTMSVSWHVDNNGDATTNGSFWYDQVWLTNNGVLDVNAVSLGYFGHNGALGVGQGYDVTQQISVPNGITGAKQLIVMTDAFNYIFESRFDGNNAAVSQTTVTLSSAPAVDLRVQDITSPTQMQAGELQTVSWRVRNAGAPEGTARQPWVDQLYVSRDGTLNPATSGAVYLGAVTRTAELTGGSTYEASLQFGVPDLGDGDWRFVVVTDAANQVYETGAADAETANSSFSAVSTVRHPDLRPTNLAVTPLVGGQPGTLSWTVQNQGTGAVNGSWVERVYLSSDATLDGADTYLGQLTVSGGLAAGASSPQSLTITPPLAAVGNYRIFVVSDADNSVREVGFEGNNSASVIASVAAAPLPDLQVSAVAAPASGLAGRTVDVSWTTSNAGNLAATGGWSEQVYLSSDNAIGGDQLLGTFYYASNNIAPGGSYARTAVVTLPANAAAGDYKLVVRVDAGNAVTEQDELNNAAIAAAPINIGAALSLSLGAPTIGEAAGAGAYTGTVQRSGATDAPLTVQLAASAAGLNLPASITLLAGQTSASFSYGAIDNGQVDGDRDRTISASATGFAPVQAAVRIIDNDTPTLSFSAPVTTIDEGYGPLTVTVTRNTDTTAAMTVAITNSKTYKLTSPDSVVIAAGASSATFTVTPVNDTVAEGNRSTDLTGTAGGFTSAGLRVDIIDNDIPGITLDLSSAVVSEAGGVTATRGILTRSTVTDNTLTVGISADAARVRIPNYVTFAAGAASVEFDLTILQNNAADGDHAVRIGAAVVDSFSGAPLPGTRVEKMLLVTDDDGPTLTLSIDRNVIAEAAGAGAATATLTRNTPATSDLIVHLSSTDTSEATVQATLVIPAGQQSITFAVNALQDGIQDGTQNVSIIAAADGFNSGNVGLQVTDRELADLQVASINTPASAVAGTTMSLSWTVQNAGYGDASGGWTDNVYLSNDSVLSGDDQLVGSFAGSTPLTLGTNYTRSISVGLGAKVGEMWAFVVTDSGNSVTELTEGNNTRSTSVIVTPPYTASVHTDAEQITQGTPVLMSGQTLNVATGVPKPFVPVSIKVTTGNTTRTLIAVADRDGNFKATFTPLAGEAGHYTIAAVYPGVIDYTPQDAFDIIGIKVDGGISASLIPGQTQTGLLTLTNLSGIALHNVHASVPALPPGVTLTFDPAVTLDGSGSATIGYSITAAADAQALGGNAPITISSDEGAHADTSLRVSVNPLHANLVSNPGSLSAGMLRGHQNQVSFEVVNTGGAATGPLIVQLPPDTPWLTLSSTATIASLAPGERTVITLLLSPGADLPLAIYQGAINVVGASTFVTESFRFRAVSEAIGDAKVTVTDEYTYFAADKPNLAGATVQLLDVYTYDVVATATTDASGVINFTGIAEGTYALQVSASQHDSVRSTVHITPGGLDAQEVFLHRQAVTYTWTVVPTEIADHYRIVLESTFQTEVPMPVVTIDDPFIMPWVFPDQLTQFNITLRNHGLIDATHVSINVPQNDPNYIITPLISELPVLAAKSEATIPCTITLRPGSPRYLAALAGNVQTVGAVDAIAGCLGIDAVYTYVCLNNVWQKVSMQLVAVDGCPDSLKGAAGSVIKYLEKKGAGNLLTAGCDVISAALQCAGFKLTACENALLTTACAAGVGALEGGPVGALGGALGNWADILACLCTLGGSGGGSGGSSGGGGSGDGWYFGGSGGGPGSPYTTPIDYTVPQTGCATPAPGSADGVSTQASGAVCAQVRLRIEQQAVITRTAFLGTLEIDNGHADMDLDDVRLTLDIRDADGNAANDKFVIRGPVMSNITVNADGTCSIKRSTNGTFQYTFVPKDSAAPDVATVYSMGGVLHYIDGGQLVNVPLLPARITVQPEAKLNLDYFWQRDVIGDDPFTDIVEASEPFALGLQVTNVGKGGAGDLTITSAQPQIVENEKGLLVDFKIISSQIGALASTPSLTVDLGNIAPGGIQSAQWNLTSSLQGHFKDFSARFEHLDDNGDLSTSLIQKVTIHELTHVVKVSSPIDDHIPDYLVNDVPDDGNLPDTLYMSTGGQAAVSQASNASMSGGGLTRTLTADMGTGWAYLSVPDALPGYELVSIVRSDGKVLAPSGGTVWRSNRTFHANEAGATNENLIHLFDKDSTGSYTFKFAIVDHIALTLTQLSGIAAGVQTAAVDAVDMTFSELIDDTTLTPADLHLTLDGVAQSLPPDLTIAYVSGNTWRVTGLAAVTGSDGNYALTVDAHGVTDLATNAGTNSQTIAWAMGANAPVIVSVQAIVPVLRNTPVASVDVVFSRAMDLATVDWTDLLLTRDGVSVDLNAGVTVTTIDAKTLRINGLDSLTAPEGEYLLTVRAAGTADSNGVAGIGKLASGWHVDTQAPDVQSIEQEATNPRNTVVQALDVVFSEMIDPTSFDWHDITLTRDGSGPNLITNEVTVEQIDATTWRIKGFNWKVGLDGTYALTVNGAGLRDLAGNAGVGSATSSWLMDIVRPLGATNLHFSPDNGISNSDGLTNSTQVGLSGILAEAGLAVRLTDLTNGNDLGYATVVSNDGVNTFTSSFKLGGSGQHKIRVRVVDSAGNLVDSTLDVFVDATAPGVSSVAAVTPDPPATPVDSLDFAFDEAIDASGLDFHDLSLTRDGVAVPLDASVTITALGGNAYRIGGLTALTGTPGSYSLTVAAAGVSDLAGNAGVGSKTSSWTTLGVLPTGIRGIAYEDSDGSGSYNPAYYNLEPLLAGRTVYLDANDNGTLDAGELSTTTAADGSYAFSDLAEGVYKVRTILPSDWLLTTPAGGAYTVNLVQGHTVHSADFGNFNSGRISGIKFNDLNGNGTRDDGEAALSGWTVFLDGNANDTLDAGEVSQVTGADGSFAFSGIGPGTFSVGEVIPVTPGVTWQRTTPAVPYHIRSGFVMVADQGDVQLGRISGSKINDLNGNGLREAAEPGIEGWLIFLDANGNGLLDAGETTTLTDAAGNYEFTGLLPGNYIVAEEQRAGWLQTTPLPAAAGVSVTTASSDIAMEADCACGAQWALTTGTAVVDYGKLSMDTALKTTGITDLRAQAPYATLDGRGTTTVVIDTGIDLNHPFFGADLNGDGIDDRIVYQYDFANDDNDASDHHGHGSNVASIIGSQDSLYRGVASGTDLISLKVFDDAGHGTFAYLEKALQWVIAHREEYHISVVNLSLGDNGNWTDQLSRYGIGDELAALAQTDVIVVGAAGNNYLQFGKMGVAYPASDPAVIAVGATWSADFGGPWTVSTGATNYRTGADEIAAFSQRDTKLMDTFAPGARFNGANANGGVTTMQGTSQAAAFVSGAAALAQQAAMRVLGRGLTTGEFAGMLRSTGVLIMDGDDEIDNVANTGQKFPRLDMGKLVAAISLLKAQPAPTPGDGTPGSGPTAPQTAAATGVHNVNLVGGVSATGRDFGNFRLASLSGTVYDDADLSGSFNAGDVAHGDITVYLDANGNDALDADERSVVTGSDGAYSFTELKPGTLHVRFDLPAGKMASGVAARDVVITSGMAATAQDFGLKSSSAAPVAHDDAASTDEDQAVMIDFAANDSTVGSLGVVLNLGAVAHGRLALQQDGKALYTPDADYFGSDGFDYTLTDNQGHHSTAHVAVTVRPVNDAPTLAAIANQNLAEGSTLNLTLAANDVDDNALTYTLLQAPVGANLDTSGHLSWTATDVAAPQTFRVRVSDPGGLSATQQFTVQVTLGKLVVTGFSSTTWGFNVRFNDQIDPALLNLYGTAAADVTISGAATGAVKGSLVLDDDGRGFSFVRTGAQLAADSYTVTIRGAADAMSNARRGALDGDTNGTAGGNYVASFALAPAPAVRLRLPDFARGPGQAADIGGAGSGLPITLASDGTVTDLRLRLRADPHTLTITLINRGANLPTDATLTVTPVAGLADQFDVVIHRATALPAGSLKLLSVIGTVPTSARLGDSGVVAIEQVMINGVAATLAGDAAVDLVGYLGDVNFDGEYTAADVTTVLRIGSNLVTSLPQIPRIDLTILADVDGSGAVNSADAAHVLARSKAASTAMIAAVPVLPPAPQPAALSAEQLSAKTSASLIASSTDAAPSSPLIDLGGSFSNFSLRAATAKPVLPTASLRILPSAVSAGATAL
ncbi:S8 family serine peptidase [Paucibacter sp. TC2R-5]|uniref:CARDB domain-containing protein n=1 Tax=Paucibacter sp. TC2R-5 TaxID=2893555 RepID=UPI0021E43E01|nr:CARDB domain-containing protein [Paucibacter sp. TC2R-5]MCV2361698.1 S8 family serine peptidase [Paucibacter sp. TC2R-5]